MYMFPFLLSGHELLSPHSEHHDMSDAASSSRLLGTRLVSCSPVSNPTRYGIRPNQESGSCLYHLGLSVWLSSKEASQSKCIKSSSAILTNCDVSWQDEYDAWGGLPAWHVSSEKHYKIVDSLQRLSADFIKINVHQWCVMGNVVQDLYFLFDRPITCISKLKTYLITNWCCSFELGL